MTTETLEIAKKIDDEIRSLTLASISDAHNIIPACVTYRFIREGYDGENEQCTTEISLSDEMR